MTNKKYNASVIRSQKKDIMTKLIPQIITLIRQRENLKNIYLILKKNTPHIPSFKFFKDFCAGSQEIKKSRGKIARPKLVSPKLEDLKNFQFSQSFFANSELNSSKYPEGFVQYVINSTTQNPQIPHSSQCKYIHQAINKKGDYYCNNHSITYRNKDYYCKECYHVVHCVNLVKKFDKRTIRTVYRNFDFPHYNNIPVNC